MRLFLFKLFIVIGLLSNFNFSFSQGAPKREKAGQLSADRTIAEFDMLGIGNQQELVEQAYAMLVEDPNVFSVSTMLLSNNNVRCYLEVNNKISFGYLEDLLSNLGILISIDALIQESIEVESKIYSSEYSSVDSFKIDWKEYDALESTMSRNDFYDMKKKEWMEKHPNEYESQMQKNKKVVVFKRDLDECNTEKRDYILSHPEIFIIQE